MFYENVTNSRDEFINKAKTATNFYGKQYLNTVQEHITNLVKKIMASVPVVLSIILIGSFAWAFGPTNVGALILINLAFIGLPIVLLVRWMMKRRDQGKLY